ncbi:MAG TPA: YqhA family protein [Ignavibacteriaceae bacterium]
MNKILSLRIVLLPMIIFIFFISVIFMIRGIWITVDVVTKMLKGELHFVHYSEDKIDRAPSLMLLEGVDAFLLVFVFFVFAFGLLKYFS